ncbi:MAG: trehalase family glycosidase [Thainema sp.]
MIPTSTSISTSTSLLPPSEDIEAVRDYIKRTWKTLTRSTEHILAAAKDSKVDHERNTRWPVYISIKEDIERVRNHLKQVLPPSEFSRIDLRVLPAEIDQIEEHGLLYLPHDYVVPGGRFNEMYGWDSYFIQLGLLRDGEVDLAQSLVDQMIYEVEHYGTVLNANRTYMLTRSQPPVLTLMILAQYQYNVDREWLLSTLPAVESYYYFWTVPPHLNQSTGLSHYYDLGEGPAPEVVVSERDEYGRTHYDRICDYYQNHVVEDYDVNLYYDRDRNQLTNLFFKGDRAMRESGLDPTNRFGPFSVDIIHYAPVCLNVLLYQMERDIAEINDILDHKDAWISWRDRAIKRRALINQFLWDEEQGQYYDYNFRTGQHRYYDYITTFYPLWVGIANPQQAKRVVENLHKFECPGGLRTSTTVTGNQWDAPFGWAPLNWIAIEGLRRYGYEEEAKRIAGKFISLLVKEFKRTGTLLEKYDVEACTGDVSSEIHFGYSSNEIGFGWTNGVLLELLETINFENCLLSTRPAKEADLINQF